MTARYVRSIPTLWFVVGVLAVVVFVQGCELGTVGKTDRLQNETIRLIQQTDKDQNETIRLLGARP